MNKRLLAVSVGLVVLGVACAELFDEPSQCKTDRDCERFGADAICNVAQAVCVSRSAAADGGLDVQAGDVLTDTTPGIDCATVPTPKPTATVPYDTTDGGAGDITSSKTLDCTKDWILDRRVYVRPGATLTIQERTTIRANAGSRLAITPGARIQAVGRRDGPIVFTSSNPTPAAGNWNGLFILGSAPPTRTPAQAFNGDQTLAASGTNADDNSGNLEYVRVEYAAEGLVLAGAGRGTKVDNVQVLKTVSNCYTFFGGTVNAKHLVCQHPGDEQFEIDVGYTGKLQFLFGQKTPRGAAQFGRNGIMFTANGTSSIVYNATIAGDSVPVQGYGVVFRQNAALDLANTILTGWFTGLDAQGNLGTPIELRGSIAFANTTNPAYAETDGGTGPDAGDPISDEDNGFDELAFFGAGARANSTANPNLMLPHDPNAPQPWPAAAITTGARTPPATTENFFDTTAVFIGAFRDATDKWFEPWARFEP